VSWPQDLHNFGKTLSAFTPAWVLKCPKSAGSSEPASGDTSASDNSDDDNKSVDDVDAAMVEPTLNEVALTVVMKMTKPAIPRDNEFYDKPIIVQARFLHYTRAETHIRIGGRLSFPCGTSRLRRLSCLRRHVHDPGSARLPRWDERRVPARAPRRSCRRFPRIFTRDDSRVRSMA
jgi:hypothetical protein